MQHILPRPIVQQTDALVEWMPVAATANGCSGPFNALLKDLYGCTRFQFAAPGIFVAMNRIFLVECRLLVLACRIQFPDQGLNLGSLCWKHRVLITGPPGNSPHCSFDCIFLIVSDMKHLFICLNKFGYLILVVKLQEFFICSGYQLLTRFMIYKSFLINHRLPFHYVDCVLQ